MDFLGNPPSDAKSANLDVGYERVTLGLREWVPKYRDSMEDESLSNLSFKDFVSLSKLLWLLVEGYEKKIISLLRKLEAKKSVE